MPAHPVSKQGVLKAAKILRDMRIAGEFPHGYLLFEDRLGFVLCQLKWDLIETKAFM